MRKFLLSFLCLLFSASCSSSIIQFPKSSTAIYISRAPFVESMHNAYAILIKGCVFNSPFKSPLIQSRLDLLTGTLCKDEYVDCDIEMMSNLCVSKYFTTYVLDMSYNTVEDIYALLQDISAHSTSTTRLLIAYSGEGGHEGLLTCTGEDGALIPSDVTLKPIKLYEALQSYPGRCAILLSACQSGIFIDSLLYDQNFSKIKFRGVILTACGQGYATTPYEPACTTAFFATFLNLYRDDPATTKNLATVSLKRAGGIFNNFRHQWVDFWSHSGLPISYDIISYSNDDFLF